MNSIQRREVQRVHQQVQELCAKTGILGFVVWWRAERKKSRKEDNNQAARFEKRFPPVALRCFGRSRVMKAVFGDGGYFEIGKNLERRGNLLSSTASEICQQIGLFPMRPSRTKSYNWN